MAMTYSQLVTAVQDYCENSFPTVDMNTMIQIAEQNIYNSVQIANLRKNVTGSLSSGNKYLSSPSDFLSVYSLAVIDTDGSYTYLLNKDVNFIREAYPSPTLDTGKPQHYAIFGPTTAGTTITNELSFIFGPTPNAAYGVELHYYYYPASIVKSGVVTGRLDFQTTVYNYVNGGYDNTPTTGGSGSGLTLDITITSAPGYPMIQAVTTNNGGQNYVVGDTVQVDLSLLTGGVDTGPVNMTILTTETAPDTSTWLSENFESVLFNATMVEAIRYMKGEQDLVKFYQEEMQKSMILLKNLGDGKQRMDAYRDGQVRNPVV